MVDSFSKKCFGMTIGIMQPHLSNTDHITFAKNPLSVNGSKDTNGLLRRGFVDIRGISNPRNQPTSFPAFLFGATHRVSAYLSLLGIY